MPSSRQAGPDYASAYMPSLVATLLVITLYALAVGAALWPRDEDPARWRIDAASGGALLINLLVVVLHVRLWLALPNKRQSAMEAFGACYDPWMGRWIVLLLMVETLAFADYGRWNLTPWLIHGVVQTLGLWLGGAGIFLVAWADLHLVHHFAPPPGQRQLMIEGLYRHVRHPRYAGLLLTRLALACMLGSMVAWLLLPCWLILVRRRIRLEEDHLHAQFGEKHAVYTRQTGSVLPIRPSSRKE